MEPWMIRKSCKAIDRDKDINNTQLLVGPVNLSIFYLLVVVVDKKIQPIPYMI